jgi:dihydroneopterin aldolase
LDRVELLFPDESATEVVSKTVHCLEGEMRFLLEACRALPAQESQDALLHYLATEPVPSLGRCPVSSVQLVSTLAGETAPVSAEMPARSPIETEHNDFGRVEVIHVSDTLGVYWLRVFPGRSIPTHVHRIMDEWEMILTEGLHIQNEPGMPGSARHWPKDFPHKYENRTEQEQVILCVDRPAFLPEDEIVLPLEDSELQIIDSKNLYISRGNG